MIATIALLSPLHHGAFGDVDTGNIVAARRIPVAMPDGRIVQVPAVSGNALRGVMRRVVMRNLFDRLGLTPEALGARPYQRLYAALANGGHLEGSEAAVNPAQREALRTALPPLSLFGAALYTYLLPGRMEVGIAWPVCRETVDAGIVPPPPVDLDGAGPVLPYAEDLVVEYSHVRHVDRDHHDPEVSGVTPMPTTAECLIPGVRLVSTIETRRCTALEASCAAWALGRITTLGGKASAGLGRVSVAADGDPSEYEAWLTDTTTARSALLELAATLGGEGKAKAKKAPKKETTAPAATVGALFGGEADE